MEIGGEIITGAIGLVVSVATYIYGKGKSDQKLSAAIGQLTQAITKFDGDLTGIGKRVRTLEDDNIRFEERFLTREHAQKEFVPTVVFNERMNSFENKLDGVKENVELLVELRGNKS
ncbi:MAG: hypothetical protein R3203_10190 [Pseudoalteromonas tetraodonis]|nr:hypothetical protein [Pseudoalteromonas tetraodonis]